MKDYSGFKWTGDEPGMHLAYLNPVVDQMLAGTSGRLLDIGCGQGAQIARLAMGKHWTLVGVDPSESGIQIAREKYGQAGRFEQIGAGADLLEQLREEPFDVAISTEVVEHVFDTPAWARAAYNALKPGGLFIASTPYHGAVKLIALALAGKMDFHFQPLKTGGHIKFFSPATLRQLLEDTGFVNVRVAGAGRMPLLWKSMVVSARKPSNGNK